MIIIVNDDYERGSTSQGNDNHIHEKSHQASQTSLLHQPRSLPGDQDDQDRNDDENYDYNHNFKIIIII